ncbi:MAG: PIN domain-containing protein [Euryarchaeota archaeon]|nr:PIN domain-containing protein [Euryarchaeota archaeon]
MNLFIDSVVWIGAKLKNDQWHKESAKIIDRFIKKEIKKAIVTDYIILESVNFILRKGGFDVALETLEIFENHERIEVINIDEITFARASAIFRKYPGLSITDASTIAVMEEFEINYIYTFDKGFDKIDGIVRLEI